jgi:ABC-type amino acid transport substrate-binding protein
VTATASAGLRLVADPYPPYQYARGGGVEGLDHALVTAAFDAAGHRARTDLTSWEECLEAVRDGFADAIYQITPTPEREEWLAFSVPFRQARSVLYRRRGEGPGEVADAELGAVASRRRLGALAGFSYGRVVDAVADKVEFGSDAELLAGLSEGKVDLAIVDSGVAAHLLGEDSDLEAVLGFAATRPLHLACRRDRIEIVQAFDAGLERMGAVASA